MRDQPPEAEPVDPGRSVAQSDAHARPVADVLAQIGVDPASGLSAPDIVRRRATAGTNELATQERPSVLGMIREAMTEPFVLLLFVAGILAMIVGEVRDGLLVLVGLVPIVGADVLTTFRSENALESLRQAAAPRARVRRDRQVEDVLAADLVPGDMVLIQTGEIVPADLRLTRAEALLIDRSMLTGESIPEPGTTTPDPPDAAMADRHALAYAGTAVVSGRAEGVVVATGPATEVGRIARDLAVTERRRSPLQRELDRLVRILLVVAVGLILITTGLGFVRGHPLGANVLAGISAAIAAIPEEPPVLLAVVLGLGAYRLLRRGVLVRRLSAEETLGAVDLIVTDKTGTLTENRLALRDVLRPDGAVVDPAVRADIVRLALRAEEDAWHLDDGTRPGSFSRALLAAIGADDPGARPDPADLVAGEGPTDGHPYSLTWSRRGGATEGQVIGAPEIVLGLTLDRGVDRAAWMAVVDAEAGQGGRLLLLARATTPRDGDQPVRWSPVAVLAFADPIRADVPAAIGLARRAGIQTIVVTGDHPATAVTIARAAGIDADDVVVGTDLAGWSDAELTDRLAAMSVVARAVPEDKLRLVDVARAAGRTVAVTGDGVNDAPALQHADVAVAMGSGTAVAREASDLVLGDDSFATLMYGLREGRRIVANVQKGLVFVVSTHVALLGFILIATIAGFSQPLLPIQILWLELFIDLATSVAFEREPEEPGAMDRPPRRRDRPLLTGSLLARISLAGGFSAVAALILMLTHDGTPDHVRWLAYTSLVVAQIVRAYANRSLERPVTSLRPNGLLAGAIVMVLLAQLAIPAVPVLADAFRATPLDATDWTLVAAIALGPAVLAEVLRRTTGRVWVA
ncbi:MAG TPA: cation-transporting P-type ATPase [Candidatus Limnocylindrales bacterium]|nr:cation-transporting P-type ATPase [Candidatus Limnocylindrales bacterium]